MDNKEEILRCVHDIAQNQLREPLEEYEWCELGDKLIDWSKNYDQSTQAFIFDVLISLAYIDNIGHPNPLLESCRHAPHPFNAHLGFINLCSCCYTLQERWQYQKAAKPPSGSIGKLASELILRFIKILYPTFEHVFITGGTDLTDAILVHTDGRVIVAEIKASPLVTFPLLVENTHRGNHSPPHHNQLAIPGSRLKKLETGLFMHHDCVVPLGRQGNELWPFKKAVNYILDPANAAVIRQCIDVWNSARIAYQQRDRDNPHYYIANASGHPPAIAEERDGWPKNQSISDSKTSAGMDRTDDIKKGIYQTLKLGAELHQQYENIEIKTAIISNLPGYRHYQDYIEIFVDTYWSFENNYTSIDKTSYCIDKKHLYRPFDYLITLIDPLLREEHL